MNKQNEKEEKARKFKEQMTIGGVEYTFAEPVQDNKGTWEELRKIAEQRDEVIYFLVSDKSHGLKGRKYQVAKDNLSSLYNRTLESFIANERKAAQEEVVREILKLSYNEMVGDGDGGIKNGDLIVDVNDIELFAKVLGINLSASNE